MTLTTAARHYGLKRPYNFRVAIPFLLNAFGLVMVLVALPFLISTGSVTIGTQRFYFLTYVAALFLLAAVLSRSFLFSFTAFLWCTLELGLALSNNLLESAIGAAVLPNNLFANPRDSRFVYHPFLQVVPRPNWYEKVRYNGRNKDFLPPAVAAYFTDRFFDRDFLFAHNSLGLRGVPITAADLERPTIFVYGGSTTYDMTVTQGETWVERLQSELHGAFTILNFGVIGHSTTEHVIYTAFYQTITNKRPVCAIYYVGWNDIVNAHVENPDPAYANYVAPHIVVRKPKIWAENYSPLLRLAFIAARRQFDSIPEPPSPVERPSGAGTDSQLERFFVEHITTIIAINRSRNIKTVFVGQMLNRDLLNSVPEFIHLSAVVRNSDVWPLQERFNSILKDTATSLGAGYIDAGIDKFTNLDFSDMGHFSAAGSSKFATLISNEVDSYCR